MHFTFSFKLFSEICALVLHCDKSTNSSPDLLFHFESVKMKMLPYLKNAFWKNLVLYCKCDHQVAYSEIECYTSQEIWSGIVVNTLTLICLHLRGFEKCHLWGLLICYLTKINQHSSKCGPTKAAAHMLLWPGNVVLKRQNY